MAYLPRKIPKLFIEHCLYIYIYIYIQRVFFIEIRKLNKVLTINKKIVMKRYGLSLKEGSKITWVNRNAFIKLRKAYATKVQVENLHLEFASNVFITFLASRIDLWTYVYR